MRLTIFGMVGQWLGMLAVIGGIIYEVHTGAHIGWVILTSGSLVYAISTKIVHRR